ncbi:helix-turn-helix transcriptional regulator [Clostridium sp.]|uniref:helix-turn-helix transcriptional regulator n=1 Tax=Clostridium sp. TaxID=1506 RepID=UPI000820F883|nr:helix-turn-helix transcriptional regulator [Clostridium sp.]SCK02107.1 HTH-type transcriptional regulator sinR [uncultured Clostridium sp.]
MRVKEKRLKRKIKQNELARRVGVSREYIRLIEKGIARNPNNELMKKISDILECSIEELFFSQKEERNNDE